MIEKEYVGTYWFIFMGVFYEHLLENQIMGSKRTLDNKGQIWVRNNKYDQRNR